MKQICTAESLVRIPDAPTRKSHRVSNKDTFEQGTSQVTTILQTNVAWQLMSPCSEAAVVVFLVVFLNKEFQYVSPDLYLGVLRLIFLILPNKLKHILASIDKVKGTFSA